MPADATSDVVNRLDSLYEFERTPVTGDKLEPPSYFAGHFSGEHVAATEFVIGAQPVSFGASATDMVAPGPAVASAAQWASRLASFKALGLAVTVVYFVAGTAWMNENEKRRARRGR